MLYKPGDSSSCPRTCVGEREDKLLQINFLIATLWSADGCVFHSLSHTLKHTRRHTYTHTHTDRQTRTDRIEENQSIGVSDLRLRLVLARTACVCVSHQLRTISACFRGGGGGNLEMVFRSSWKLHKIPAQHLWLSLASATSRCTQSQHAEICHLQTSPKFLFKSPRSLITKDR